MDTKEAIIAGDLCINGMNPLPAHGAIPMGTVLGKRIQTILSHKR